MRVVVHLTIDGHNEICLEGNAVIFDSHIMPWLGDIGFWLADWRYEGHGGPSNKGRVFVPWVSSLMVQELK